MALQGLRDVGKIQSGHRVLINGAGGGVGTFAVQIAKSHGAHVTGVDSAPKLELIRALGADEVIDYAREDFTDTGQRYDLILDVVVHRSIFECRRALSPQGIFVIVGGASGRIIQFMLVGPWLSMAGSKKTKLLLAKPNANIETLKELIEAGEIEPIIDRRYPLRQVPEAVQYLGDGHARGKLVITME
jgi:NADPH:quinone reductase-like Zn-dependent oxidoreductase